LLDRVNGAVDLTVSSATLRIKPLWHRRT